MPVGGIGPGELNITDQMARAAEEARKSGAIPPDAPLTPAERVMRGSETHDPASGLTRRELFRARHKARLAERQQQQQPPVASSGSRYKG